MTISQPSRHLPMAATYEKPPLLFRVLHEEEEGAPYLCSKAHLFENISPPTLAMQMYNRTPEARLVLEIFHLQADRTYLPTPYYDHIDGGDGREEGKRGSRGLAWAGVAWAGGGGRRVSIGIQLKIMKFGETALAGKGRDGERRCGESSSGACERECDSLSSSVGGGKWGFTPTTFECIPRNAQSRTFKALASVSLSLEPAPGSSNFIQVAHNKDKPNHKDYLREEPQLEEGGHFHVMVQADSSACTKGTGKRDGEYLKNDGLGRKFTKKLENFAKVNVAIGIKLVPTGQRLLYRHVQILIRPARRCSPDYRRSTQSLKLRSPLTIVFLNQSITNLCASAFLALIILDAWSSSQCPLCRWTHGVLTEVFFVCHLDFHYGGMIHIPFLAVLVRAYCRFHYVLPKDTLFSHISWSFSVIFLYHGLGPHRHSISPPLTYLFLSLCMSLAISSSPIYTPTYAYSNIPAQFMSLASAHLTVAVADDNARSLSMYRWSNDLKLPLLSSGDT
ncbi:hypothetical protein FIBSPDRAFT_883732 [Athelia psychrophila]|uniref:Uncharacterized protein n=1 Tax=Athelia psychrophila TaxID=1759441 RepID=A0A166TVQ7_9AGAM|nr:hypothetical protein FIBSPDRAFT_883732 [Fibularhizoctonia sp. CBS 109695]